HHQGGRQGQADFSRHACPPFRVPAGLVPPLCPLRKRKANPAIAKTKAVPRRKLVRISAASVAGNERMAKKASVSVVSEVLIPAPQIFDEFGADRLNCWIPMLNGSSRLPLVLALFSSN
ncbi:hypothetical protein, partial [Mesorhizobium sp. M1A.F.Ca.IN.022.05.2.1]|uniref:hypothetical protein n=1 Tax=Mesorhizobium sp. M1A.F.Ca.IN.022.05.2.1 TaxID=2496760 RepID=UPI0019D24725